MGSVPLGPLLISKEEAERIRMAQAEAYYKREQKIQIAKAKKHLELALRNIDKLIELERLTKIPGPFELKRPLQRLLPREPAGPRA